MSEAPVSKKSFLIQECTTNSIVVYKDRAEVKREVSIAVTQGENEVTFTGLSEAVDADSIRVEGQGSAVILDVVYGTKEVVDDTNDDGERGSTHKALLQQIEEKDKDLKLLEFRQKAIERQKELLDIYSRNVIEVERQQRGYQEGNMFAVLVNDNKVSSVLEFMKQYEGRLASLDERLIEIKNNKCKLTEEKQVLVTKAAEVDPNTIKKKSEIIRNVKVIIGAKVDCDVMLTLSYVVSNASWMPAYDVRVFSKDKLIKLHYYGMIKQSTGENWNNTNISLSTAQPDIGGSPPILPIHHIGFVRPRAVAVKSYAPTIGFASSRLSAFDDMYDPTIEDCYNSATVMMGQERFRAVTKTKKSRRRSISPPSLDVDVTKVEKGQLYNTTYKIPRKSTVPPDNSEHKVTVAIIDLSPDFSYVSVPKKSPLSFLQAKVKNNSAYAFLSGPANVFLDNNFLAKSVLSDTSPTEEFTCSLGADQSIRVTTQPAAIVRGTTGRLTKNNLITYTYTYTVKNTQANVVQLKVKDQVPLSSDERLKVVMMEPDIKKQEVSVLFSYGSVLINEDNNIEWSCTIPPNEQIDLKLVFALEFPPFDVVEGLQS